MKRKPLIPFMLFMLVFLLLLLACGGNQVDEATSATPNAATERTTSASEGFSLLVVASGLVELKRERWSEYHSTLFGARLYPQDLIKSDEEIVILCEDLTLWTIPGGMHASVHDGCPPTAEPALIHRRYEIHNRRAMIDFPSIPYIITPRRTRLLTDQPRLRWNEVAGVSSYTVSLQGVEGVEWEAELNDTEIVYPGDPPLQAGKNYFFSVKADNGRFSTEEEPAGLGFVLLSPEDAQRMQTYTTKINGFNLPDESQALALAHLYAGQLLMAEAIEMLELLAENGSQTPSTYHLLGDLYQQTHLPLLAESPYTQAITLSQAANDIEGQAAVQATLGEIHKVQGDRDKAIRWLSEAHNGYQILGDTERLKEVEKNLQQLGP